MDRAVSGVEMHPSVNHKTIGVVIVKFLKSFRLYLHMGMRGIILGWQEDIPCEIFPFFSQWEEIGLHAALNLVDYIVYCIDFSDNALCQYLLIDCQLAVTDMDIFIDNCF